MPKSDTLISPMRAALILQVNPRTITRWADDETFADLTVAEVTNGGQRRYSLRQVERLATKRAKASAA